MTRGNQRPGERARREPPVRILIVASEAPPIVSGISRCVDRLTVGLRARGHHVDVIFPCRSRG